MQVRRHDEEMISKHLEKNLKLLYTLQSLPEKTKKIIINDADRSLIIAICEICLNLLCGTFCCTPKVKRKLKKFKNKLKKLASRKKLSKNFNIEKKIINQYGGSVNFLAYLIPPALEYIFHHLSSSSSSSSTPSQ